MLSYLMSLIVNCLVSVLIHKPRKRMKADPNKKVWTGEASVDALSQSTAALLERRGLGALMLRDFSFQQRLRRCDINSQALEEKLRAMALEITSHLSLPPLRQVNVVRIDDDRQIDRFGEYDSAGKRINFYIKPKNDPEQITAALCHECTHYFMEMRELNDWSDRLLNERRTDVTACLIGFSRIMVRGYMILTKSHYRVVAWTADSNRVGYLDAADCDQVRKNLIKLRPGLQKRRAEEDNVNALKARLNQNIAGAKAMTEQVRAMLAAHGAPTGGRMPAKSLAGLQRALLALENGELETRIRQCESASRGDVGQLRAASNDIMAVCEALSTVLSAFKR